MERILLIEDDQALGRGTALALAGEGREIRVAATLAQGWAALGEGGIRAGAAGSQPARRKWTGFSHRAAANQRGAGADSHRQRPGE